MIRPRRALLATGASLLICALGIVWLSGSASRPRVIGTLTADDLRELRHGARLAHQETIAESRLASGIDSLWNSTRLAFATVETISGQSQDGMASVAYRNGFASHDYYIYWFGKSRTNGWVFVTLSRHRK